MNPNVLPALVMVAVIGLAVVLITRHLPTLEATEEASEAIPAAVFDSLKISVYQGSEGPTVSLINHDGEIFTKTFTTWGRASAYVSRTKLTAEGDGIAVTFLTESV